MFELIIARIAAAALICGAAFGLMPLGALVALAAEDETTRLFVLEFNPDDTASPIGDADLDAAVEASIDVVKARFGAGNELLDRVTNQGGGIIHVQTTGPDARSAVETVFGITKPLEFRIVDPDYTIEDEALNRVPDGSEALPSADGSPPVVVRLSGGMTVDRIARAAATIDEYTYDHVVLIEFGEEAARQFAELTRDHVGQRIAIVLDGQVQSAPQVNEPIVDGKVQISGGFTAESAHELAVLLGSGALPVPFTIVEERILD